MSEDPQSLLRLLPANGERNRFEKVPRGKYGAEELPL
jgi:hypothetical protein